MGKMISRLAAVALFLAVAPFAGCVAAPDTDGDDRENPAEGTVAQEEEDVDTQSEALTTGVWTVVSATRLSGKCTRSGPALNSTCSTIGATATSLYDAGCYPANGFWLCTCIKFSLVCQ